MLCQLWTEMPFGSVFFWSFPDDRHRRLFAASETRAAGRGGIAAVSSITGVARSRIGRGLEELGESDAAAPGGLRRRTASISR